MSAAETRTLLQAYYDAFNRADSEAFFDLLSDDVVHDLNQGPRESGKDAFRAFAARMSRSYRENISDLAISVNEDGSRAAVEYVVNGTYLATDEGLPEAKGQTYRLAGGAFFEVRGGRVARVTNYYNLQDWLSQVGA
ncbi:MAG TPA: ketosteroid isomerase-related protein [Polyangiaceae bacterium]|nr:ketosteroid isomerase-related protein [Polyangiaceae bacterium]